MSTRVLLIGVAPAAAWSEPLRRLGFEPVSLEAGWAASEALERDAEAVVVVGPTLEDGTGRDLVEELADRQQPPRIAWAGPLPAPHGASLSLDLQKPPEQAVEPLRALARQVNSFHSEFLALQQEYRLSVPQRVVELRDAVIRLRDQPGPGALEQAIDLAHRIHGTAGAYGYPALGLAARSMELILRRSPLAWPELERALGEAEQASRLPPVA